MPGPVFDIDRQVALPEALGGLESLPAELTPSQPAAEGDSPRATTGPEPGSAPIVHITPDLADASGEIGGAGEAGAAVSGDQPSPAGAASPAVEPATHGSVGSNDVWIEAPDAIAQVDVHDTGVAPLDAGDTPWASVFAHTTAVSVQSTGVGSASPLALPASPALADPAGEGIAAIGQAGFVVFSEAGVHLGLSGVAAGHAVTSAPAEASEARSAHAAADPAHLIDSLASLSGGAITEAGIGSGGATPAQVQQALDESGLSVNGSGIKVGVLSDSFNNLGGAAADEADGALPGASHVQVLSDYGSGGSDEGRAMMQIIHDIAPGADLAFYTAFNGEQAFANGILALAAAGCKVICDDVSYFDEPFFQNGVVAQAIQKVEAEGVTYVTAAGNDASNGYQAAWTPISGSFDGVNFADAESFGGSLVQTITINTEGTGFAVPLLLEWSQAYGNAASDLRLRVFKNGQEVGTATNASSGEPANPWLEYDFSQSGTYQVVIEKLSGPDPGLIKEVTAGDGLPATISGANSGTVVGHAMTPGVITAGAVSAADTPAFGVNPALSESFSSSGAGAELLFDNNGNPLSSPDLLNPVAVSGLDGISTTVPGLTDFYGTSAASASLAGVAALILADDPNLTPTQVEQLMQGTALPMSNAAVSGAGLVQVDAAIAAASPYVVRTNTNALASASLVESGGQYRLYDSRGPSPVLKYGGSPVVIGEFGHWAPIGAAATASGYDVAWKLAANDYWVWKVDGSGDFTGSIVAGVPGTNLTLQVLERTFHQDLNGDRRIGPPATDFVFDYPLAGPVRHILHFNRAVDRIVLSAADYNGIGPIGHALAAREFAIGPRATHPWQRILYHSATGYIDYHPIGGGPHDLIHFAHVSPHLAMTHGDFLVVA